MIKTEKMILEEIMRLLKNLENVTYGEYRTNGIVFPPNASSFYYSAKQLYECTDELMIDLCLNMLLILIIDLYVRRKKTFYFNWMY